MVRFYFVRDSAMNPAKRRSVLGLLAAAALVLFGCKGKAPVEGQGGVASAEPAKQGPVSLNGAGATFPYPLYSKWMSEYNRIHPDIMINYQSIGSGGGIRQITAKTVDFGASDAPMTADEESKAPSKIAHLPMTLGAVVLAYNLAVLPELKLTPEVVAGIFLGTITKWNDAKIASANAGAKLPDTAIVVVSRSDGSGTTAVFTDYLGKTSPEWKDKVGVGKSVKFPVGLGAKGNEGVTGQVKTSPGAIGYVELAYATQNGLSMATLKNANGEFVKPTIAAVTAAAAGVDLPDELHASITDAKGAGAYPISSYSYVLVFEDAPDTAKGKALATFLWWAIHDGQKLSEPLYYAPLPAAVVTKAETKLKALRGAGKPLLSES
jgi:phosphate transport system substrate-binding protein